MEHVTDILQERLKRIARKAQERDTGQASMTGNGKGTVSSCNCENYASLWTILETCSKYDSPFEDQLCGQIEYKWREVLRNAGIYERFWGCNFKRIEQRGIPAGVRKQYSQVKQYADNLMENLQDGKGLILKGPVGTMKTTLAVSILQEALWRGVNGRKILIQSLLDDIFTLKARNTDEWLKFEKELRESRLLVVDELGKHQSEGWVMTKFEAIVSERHERRRSTIFVTNLTARELRGLYSEGVIDRFNHVNEVVNFSGNSLRVKGD